MVLRLAKEEDLPEINLLFSQITADLDKKGICIWDEIYPACAFPEDIKNEGLFVLEEGGALLGAFALCDAPEDEGSIVWEKPSAKAKYLYRLGVSPRFLKRGLGSELVRQAQKIAAASGAEYLRLLVVDFNAPAESFYLKLGYTRAQGIYDKPQNGIQLREYGYEKKLAK